MSPATPKILRYQELAENMADLIRHGTYLPGQRIPSVRLMSRQQNLSISTVLQAYSLLERQGLVEARPQSGYYVRARVAAGRFSAELERLKFALSPSCPSLPQMVVAEFLDGGGYDQHLRRLRREYARNVELMSDAVMRYFPEGTRLTRPSGGFILWVQLPEKVDSLELYKIALQAGITLAPGHVFSATDQFSNFIRLNAATFNYSMDRALERLGEMIFELAK